MSIDLLRPVPKLMCVAITFVVVCVFVGAIDPEAVKENEDAPEESSCSTGLTVENLNLYDECDCGKDEGPLPDADDDEATKDSSQDKPTTKQEPDEDEGRSQDKPTIKQEPDESEGPVPTPQLELPFPTNPDDKTEATCNKVPPLSTEHN
uniref:Uncharacterized protein n=1 Tax=Spongospora subterranea TaxID=70186 RepID=A0A0H5R3K8_9EUKA|eukprot:CRZ08753.1 hypothetical protein [Spongospora subterranea]